MKFRDPKTGKVFKYTRDAINAYCGKECEDCPIAIENNQKHLFCFEYVSKFPTEAAHLMGYEVIDDSSSDSSSDSSTEIDETPTDTPTTLDDTPTEKLVKQKPRLAEVLGVEVGERFQVGGWEDGNGGYWIDENGDIDNTTHAGISIIMLVDIINHPESIIRAPRLTEPEIAIMRAVGAKFAFLNPGECFITLSVSKPKWDDKYGRWLFTSIRTHDPVCKVRNTLFPSVHTGDCLPSPYTS